MPCQSHVPFEVWLENQTRMFKLNFIILPVDRWRHTQKAKPVQGVYPKPRSLRIKWSISTSQIVNL